MRIYAVIDTNVIVSSMLTRNSLSPTKEMLVAVRDKVVVPMINADILEEYKEVLSRNKFRFASEDIDNILHLFDTAGEIFIPESIDRDFVDMNDVIFYETYLMRPDSYLVTGNLRHFPSESRILSPFDMISIVHLAEDGKRDVLNERSGAYLSETMCRAWESVERMRASAVANGIADMSMEEIDEEIRQYREEKRNRG